MKIGFFGTRMDLISGHSRPALELARQLQARGHQVRVLTSYLTPLRQQHHDSIPSSGQIELERVFTSYTDLFRISGALKDFLDDCDILHEFSTYGLPVLPHSGQRTVPRVISIPSGIRVPLGKYLKGGAFATRHGPQARFLLRALMPGFVLKKLLSRAQAIITWTKFTYRQVAEIGIPEHRISHIPVGIDHARFKIQSASSRPESPTFLYLGPAAPIQGVDLLLRAFARFRSDFPLSHLIIADRGPDIPQDVNRHQDFKRTCLQIASEMGLTESVTWKGFVPDISTLYNNADAVILPYRIALGYSQPPLSLIEALSHGKPVISTFCGSVPEFIVPGENGILVQPDDLAALAEGMRQFAIRPLAHRAQEISSQVIHNHAWPAIVDAHLNVYERVLLAMGA